VRARVVTDTDIALLRAVGKDRSVVAASAHVGLSRDQATYRIARLARLFGGAVVAGVRGGRAHGGTRLTALGDRIARRGFDSVELLPPPSVLPPRRSNLLRGVYHGRPSPEVTVGRGVRLRVTFAAGEGESVSLRLDPEAILVAPAQFPSSARNVLPATVAAFQRGRPPLGSTLLVRTGAHRLRVAITEESVRQLRLARGSPVWLYVKATAVQRVGRPAGRPTRGSLPR
jgi:molybdopterin-binding protein/molybdate transport repressor ModE-like protein